MGIPIRNVTNPGHTISGILNWLVYGTIALLIVSWLPHYLIWPLWPDAHAYAALAIGWENGIEPYRDVQTFNFPGQIYVFWILGKVFGWDQTWAFYAADAALIGTVGAALIYWSRRVFGEAISGAIGFLGLLVVLLDLDISLAAQRDWHSTAFVILSLVALQCGPPRGRTVLSALAFAAGFVFRPHVVLFGPAIITAILLERTDPQTRDLRPAIRTAIVWAITFGIGLFVGFLPLLANGLFGDFLEDLKLARHGGSYAGMTLKAAILLFLAKFVMREYLLVFVSTLTLALKYRGETLRIVLPWSVAMIFAMAYQSVHPIAHFYLMLPLYVIYAVNLAILAALVRKTLGAGTPAATAMTAAVALLACNKVPDECSISASRKAVVSLVTGVPVKEAPPGALPYFPNHEVDPKLKRSGYPWADYVATIEYLKANTTPRTLIAGSFKRMPFPAFNGATGRPTPWPGEGGSTFLMVLGKDWQKPFGESLIEAPQDTVVVWVPGEVPETDRLATDELDQVVKDHFVPEARFGIFEIYRRKPAGK